MVHRFYAGRKPPIFCHQNKGNPLDGEYDSKLRICGNLQSTGSRGKQVIYNSIRRMGRNAFHSRQLQKWLRFFLLTKMSGAHAIDFYSAKFNQRVRLFLLNEYHKIVCTCTPWPCPCYQFWSFSQPHVFSPPAPVEEILLDWISKTSSTLRVTV